jgi:hypothetical protein
MIKLAVITFTVWLAMILGNTTLAQPTPLTTTPPEGVTLHWTNSQMYRDRAGVIFAATRASSDVGGVVWRDAGNGPEVVLQLGPAEMFGNGELVVWPDGLLYYVTVDQAQTHIAAYQVAGWTP